MEAKFRGFLREHPDAFDDLMSSDPAMVSTFLNPLTGKTFKRYGTVWKTLAKVLNEEKGAHLALDDPCGEPRRTGKVKIGDREWDIFGDVRELTAIFENVMGMNQLKMVPRHKTAPDWTQEEIQAFTMCQGIYDPRTGLKLPDRERVRYAEIIGVDLGTVVEPKKRKSTKEK